VAHCVEWVVEMVEKSVEWDTCGWPEVRNSRDALVLFRFSLVGTRLVSAFTISTLQALADANRAVIRQHYDWFAPSCDI